MTTLTAEQEEVVYERPSSFTDAHTIYCPGCTHGTAHRLVGPSWLPPLAVPHSPTIIST
jgi:hypothetical protein